VINVWSLTLAAGSLVVSLATAWLTLFKPGKLKMTRPTLFYLGPDGKSAGADDDGKAKVFVRGLLYATSKRGKLIENMYAGVTRGGATQPFNIWVYREEGRLSRGSGLHVDKEGKAFDHHFLIPADSPDFHFSGGDYVIKIYAKIVNVKKPVLLQEVSAHLPNSIAREAASSGGGAFFDWAPNLNQYYVHSRPPPTSTNDPLPDLLPAVVTDLLLAAAIGDSGRERNEKSRERQATGEQDRDHGQAKSPQ
jgi:hypothetical protein